jgi:hypothetical protein
MELLLPMLSTIINTSTEEIQFDSGNFATLAITEVSNFIFAYYKNRLITWTKDTYSPSPYVRKGIVSKPPWLHG